MKKVLLFLFALLGLGASGVWAQTVTATLMEGYGDPLKLEQFKALAGTTGRFGFVASSNTASATSPRCDHWCKFTSVHNTTTLDEEALFYLEASGNNYKVKRSSDGLYVITSTSETSFGNDGTAFKLVNRVPNDTYKAVTGDYSISFEDPSDASMHYNANAVKYNNGAGAWTTYAVFGPFYKVTVNCLDADGTPLRDAAVYFVQDGTTISAPVIDQYRSNKESVTVNGADETLNCYYSKSAFSGQTFTLQCARGYVYYDGTQLAGTNSASDASKFAIVAYKGDEYLFDATQTAFVCHTTAATGGYNGNPALESKNDFTKAVKNISFGATNIEAYPFYIQEDEFTNWLNMDGIPMVYFNRWTDFEGGAGGNTYKVEVVDDEFDDAAAVAMLDEFFNPSATVTYVISDANGTEVFRSEAQSATIGEIISELPEDLKRAYCEYSVTSTEIVAGENMVNVTVTFNNMPFEVSADYASAKWYYMTLRGKYLSYGESTPYKGTDSKDATNEAYQWAFIGTPYGINIINKAAGNGKYLSYDNAANNISPYMKDSEKGWVLDKNNSGFVFRLPEDKSIYMHLRTPNLSTCSVSEWSAVHNDAGSTFTVEEVPDIMVTVTYQLVEGGEVINSIEVAGVPANSALNVPSSLTAKTYYDYTTTGTIGTEDCTITVTRTLKDNVVIDLNGLSNEKCYNIRNNRGTWAVGKDASDVNSTVELSLAFQATDTKQQFAIIGYEGNFYLYSVGEKKFAYVDGTKLSLTAEVNSAVESSKVTFVNSTSANYANSAPTVIQVGGNSFGVSTGKSPDVYKYSPHLDDDGNASLIEVAGDFDATAALAALDDYFHPSYTITYVVKDANDNTLFTSDPVGTTLGATITELPTEYKIDGFYTYNNVDLTVSAPNTTATFIATPKENPLVKYTADATSPVWYKLKLSDANYPTYVANVAEGEFNVQTPTTANDDATTYQWAFIGEPYAGFQMINRAAGTNLVLGSATTIGIGDTGASVKATLAAPGTQARELWYLSPSSYLSGGFFLFNADGHALNQRGPGFLAYWTNGADKGSTFTATEVLEGEALFNELIAQLEAINWGTGLNHYKVTGDLAGFAGNEAALIAQLEAGEYSDAKLQAAQDMLNNYALNMPSPGFYRIKGSTSGMYLAAGLASNNKFAMSDATDASTIFYYDGTKLTNFGSGMCNGMNKDAWAWVKGDAASTVEFQDGLTNGGYAIKSTNANFYDNGDNSNSADRGSNLTINSSANERYRKWYLEAVSELPIALNDGEDGKFYATLCLPFNATLNGTTAYTLSASGTTLNMSDGSTSVAAGTPVLLIGESATATATITPSNTPAEVETGGTLTGTYLPIAFNGDKDYVLGKDDAKVGFFHWEGTILKGFRAYIAGEAAVVAGGQVKGFYLNNDIATQIREMVGASDSKAAYYDLSGRRVAQPTRGLYIVNGKKVAVK